MSFLVTARKWRPQLFKDVVGQEHITETLKNAIKTKRIAHAYLFTGPRGVGKTTTARILAKTLNCLAPADAEPCDNCEMCKSILNSQSFDIIEIDGASNRGIDEVRALRDSVKYAPTKGKYKVYIIDEVHMLTRESFNAFLKTLEEPPPYTIFVFATTDVHKVPLTIVSRCQRFDFRRIQLDTIKSLLAKIADAEGIEIDDKSLTIIAKKADGALRDAESFFDQVVSFCGKKIDSDMVAKMLNLIDDDIYFNISDAVIKKNYQSVFEVSDVIYDNGWNFVDFMDGLVEHFRNILTVILTGSSGLVESAEVYKSKYLKYIDQFSEADLLRILNFLNRTQQELRFSQNQKLKIEISLSHLIGLEKSSSISDLIAKFSGDTSINFSPSSAEDKPAAQGLNSNIRKKTSAYPEVQKKPSDDAIKEKSFGITNEFNFDMIVKKWEEFVNSASEGKSFILGPIMNRLRPVNLEGSKLNAYIDDEGKQTFVMYNDYLNRIAMEVFGRKISLNLTENNPPAEVIPNQNLDAKPTKKRDSGNSLVNSIITELGGEEIG